MDSPKTGQEREDERKATDARRLALLAAAVSKSQRKRIEIQTTRPK